MRGVNALPAAVRPPGRVGAPPFADVVAEHLDAVYRYLVYLTGDRAAAEDLAAETFERAFKSWRRFDPRRGAPRTWLCRIAHSAAVDWFRGFREIEARLIELASLTNCTAREHRDPPQGSSSMQTSSRTERTVADLDRHHDHGPPVVPHPST